MMRLEELKLEKVANEDLEVFPDGRRTKKTSTSKSKDSPSQKHEHQGTGNKSNGKTYARDSPRPKNLVRFGVWFLYVFIFNQEDFERNLNLHSTFGDRCQTL